MKKNIMKAEEDNNSNRDEIVKLQNEIKAHKDKKAELSQSI